MKSLDRVRMDWVAREVRNTVGPEFIGSDTIFHYSIPVIDETGDGRLEPTEDLGSSKTVLVGGEVLISKLNPRKARVLIAEGHDVPTVCSGEFVVLQPRDVERRYLYWLLLSEVTRQELHSQVQSVTRSQQRARPDDISKMWIELPSREAQRAIASYLDAETARIDALIGRKRDLLDLLATRRASFVVALVAGKQDASPRADLPWLAAVPSSWPTAPLGLLADVFNGSTPERQEGDLGGIPWTTSGDIDQGVITTPTAYITDGVRRAHGLRIAPAGSIVVGLVGQGRPRGLSAQLAISTTLNQNLAAICPRDDRLDASYVGLLLGLAYDDLRNGGRGGNQAALNCEMIKAYRLPVAPRDEQTRLVDNVAVQRTRDDAMAALLTSSIELLLERRQTLITAAVTGQLAIPGVAA